MKNQLKFLPAFMCFIFFIGCKDESNPTIVSPDYTENYKYYPVKDNYEWNYEVKTIDNIKGSTEVITELHKYNTENTEIDYLRSDTLWSGADWTHRDNKLYVDGTTILLLDYGKLGCISDTSLTYKIGNADIKITLYQYCKKQFATEVTNYNTIPCIRTDQFAIYKEGNYSAVTRYFGFEIGLVFEQVTEYDKFGKIETQQTTKLVSHKF